MDTVDLILATASLIAIFWMAVSLLAAYGHIQIHSLQKENRKLRRELSDAVHSLAVKNAMQEGDVETARMMAAIKRDNQDKMVKTKPPVSAGAKKAAETGVLITQTG